MIKVAIHLKVHYSSMAEINHLQLILYTNKQPQLPNGLSSFLAMHSAFRLLFGHLTPCSCGPCCLVFDASLDEL